MRTRVLRVAAFRLQAQGVCVAGALPVNGAPSTSQSHLLSLSLPLSPSPSRAFFSSSFSASYSISSARASALQSSSPVSSIASVSARGHLHTLTPTSSSTHTLPAYASTSRWFSEDAAEAADAAEEAEPEPVEPEHRDQEQILAFLTPLKLQVFIACVNERVVHIQL
jgi:hypothetical protein